MNGRNEIQLKNKIELINYFAWILSSSSSLARPHQCWLFFHSIQIQLSFSLLSTPLIAVLETCK